MNISDFISDKDELKLWLVWWKKRKHLIFKVFTAFDALQLNLAEVIHARWTNQGEVGLNLLDSTKFNVINLVLVRAQLSQLSETESGFGEVPRNVKTTKRKGQTLFHVGVESNLVKQINRLSLAKKKEMVIFCSVTVWIAAANLIDTIKVRKSCIVSKKKRECTVSSITMRKVDYAVVITNIPSSIFSFKQPQGIT